MSMTPEETKALAWMDENPNRIYSASYDDIISDEQAKMILSGDFDKFSETVFEIEGERSEYAGFWSEWQKDFARHMGHDDWDDVPEDLQEFAKENRQIDSSDWLNNAIRHWKGNIAVSIRKADMPENENMIYVPSGRMRGEDTELVRYLIDTFDPEIPEGEGSPEERLQGKLDVVYGGYDGESLTLIGRVNLFDIYDAGKKLTHVTVGPQDSRHLIFFDDSNGCGNMGIFKIRNEVTLPAVFEIDSTRKWNIDRVYGYTGDHWNHEIRAVAEDVPEPVPYEAPGM